MQVDEEAILKSTVTIEGDTTLKNKTLYIKNADASATHITLSPNDNTSTSKTTGALVVAGGVGIGKDLYVGQDIVAFASSDERLKDNITPIENSLEKVKSLSGNTFTWNDKATRTGDDVGVIAQEVQKVLPQIIDERDDGYLAVDYQKLIPLLIESIKELSSKVEYLEQKLQDK